MKLGKILIHELEKETIVEHNKKLIDAIIKASNMIAERQRQNTRQWCVFGGELASELEENGFFKSNNTT